MENLKPPQLLSFEGNISENWKKFKQSYNIYIKATEINKKENEVQVNIFLHVIGEEAVDKFNAFELTKEKKDINKVVAEFEKFFLPKANESVDRHIFFTRMQEKGESLGDFGTALKKLSSPCGFGELHVSLIRDRIIREVKDKVLKDRLLREGDLTLEKCMKIAKASELAEIQLKMLQEEKKIEFVKKNEIWKPGKNSSSNVKKPGYKNINNSGFQNRISTPCGSEM